MWINPTYTELSLGSDWEETGKQLGSNWDRMGKRWSGEWVSVGGRNWYYRMNIICRINLIRASLLDLFDAGTVTGSIEDGSFNSLDQRFLSAKIFVLSRSAVGTSSIQPQSTGEWGVYVESITPLLQPPFFSLPRFH